MSAVDRSLSIPAYRHLLEELLGRGYRAATFTDPPSTGDHAVILRHDLDVDPTLALGLARVEADLGLRATYFVLLTSPLYNPATTVNRQALADLLALGHEVGLHFDAAPHGTLPERDAALRREVAGLELLLDQEVRAASFHRPGAAAAAPELPGLVSAYERRFVEDIAYLTDSGGSFRFGHPLDSDAVAQGRSLQLLTHPIWWAEHPLGEVAERIDAWHGRNQHRLRRTLGANIRPYAAHLEELDDAAL